MINGLVEWVTYNKNTKQIKRNYALSPIDQKLINLMPKCEQDCKGSKKRFEATLKTPSFDKRFEKEIAKNGKLEIIFDEIDDTLKFLISLWNAFNKVENRHCYWCCKRYYSE